MSPPKEEGYNEFADVETDKVGDLTFSPPPMKHSDTRDSISSIDSDISLTYDGNGEPIAIASASGDDEGAHLADQSDCGSDTGSTTGKDSGCEITDKPQEPPFVKPDEELANRIVKQVEFYFSDVNITKDAFLLKHVKRNKEGFVSLKLISSFKRVKHLAKDWRVVASALARSTKLEINDAGTKLRRLAPLPQYDETTPSRTVVAMHLPHDKPTIESVAELFSCYGEIALVRILRPGNPVPADVRNFVAKRPELDGIVCALVEFVNIESAEKAVQSPGRDWKGHSLGIKVAELNPPERIKKRSLPSKKAALTRFFEAECSSSCASGSEAEPENRQRHRLRRGSSSSSGRSATCMQPSNWMQRRLAYNRDSGSESSCSSLYCRSRCNSVVSDTGSCTSYNRSRCNSGVSDSQRSRCNSGVSDSHRSRCNSGVSDSQRSRCNSGVSDSQRSRCNSGVSDSQRSRCNSGVSDSHRSRCNSGVSDSQRSRCNSGVSDSQRSRCNSGVSDSQRSRCNSGVSDSQRSRCNSGVSDSQRCRCNSGVSDSQRSRCNSGVSDSRPRSNSGASHLPDNVIRLPRGPDGTRGFHCGYREKIAATLAVG